MNEDIRKLKEEEESIRNQLQENLNRQRDINLQEFKDKFKMDVGDIITVESFSWKSEKKLVRGKVKEFVLHGWSGTTVRAVIHNPYLASGKLSKVERTIHNMESIIKIEKP